MDVNAISYQKQAMAETRIIVDVWRDARAAILSGLAELELPERQRSRVATAVLYSLRAAGFCAGWIEYHYSATALAVLLGRSDEYVMRLIRNRELSPVAMDGRGWLIPASTAQAFLDARLFGKSTTFNPIETGLRVGKKSAIASAGGLAPGGFGAVPVDQGAGSVERALSKRVAKGQQNEGVSSGDADGDAGRAQAESERREEQAVDAGEPGTGGGGSDPGGPSPSHMRPIDHGFQH